MKKFLASVGHAQLIGKKDGELYHIADVQTLTESSLGFSSSIEDVRAGQGAKLYGRFSHTTGMTVTLTDAMFDLNYIALQIGSEIKGDATAFENESLPVDSKKITLSKEPQAIGLACGLDHVIIWARKVGCAADADWTAIELKKGGKEVDLTDTIFADEEKVCVRYFVNKPEARRLDVSASFVPAEMILILTTRLFAGDANNVETGKPVGYITVKVPRFQLDGSFDLNMAMTSAATVSLSGTALAVSDGSCDDNGIYAEIVEVSEDAKLMSISSDEESEKANETPVIFGEYVDGHASLLDNAEDLIFIPALTSGEYAAGQTYEIKAVKDDTIKTSVTIAE